MNLFTFVMIAAALVMLAYFAHSPDAPEGPVADDMNGHRSADLHTRKEGGGIAECEGFM